MSTCDQTMPFVRIIELPPIRMARSGNGDLEAFNKYWSRVAAEDKSSLFPRDFLWFNPQLDCFEWLYALPAGVEDTGGYATFEFPGGLYAVAACRDEGADIERTNKLIHQWVAESEQFDQAPSSGPGARWDMGHIITPLNAQETLGYHQMDLFIPIVYRGGQG
ncbi:MAG: GyrI-like domain-containing protein [Chloroflexi bacterium]|nr:GyrI-like domain-containing protein [Chloroflexota bacterium]